MSIIGQITTACFETSKQEALGKTLEIKINSLIIEDFVVRLGHY